MKTRISQEGDVTIVELSGYLDFETARPLADSIVRLYEADKQTRLVINLVGLEFVGSSGISSFVKAMRGFNSMRIKPSYFGVKSEFLRLFRLFEENEPFDIFASKDEATTAALERYNRWQMTSPRSKRTH